MNRFKLVGFCLAIMIGGPHSAIAAESSGVPSQVCRSRVAITPSDSTIIRTAAIFVGTGGDLNLEDDNGNVALLKNVAAGVVHPFYARRVLATGTTATDLVSCN
jgi:hypothetical protein